MSIPVSTLLWIVIAAIALAVAGAAKFKLNIGLLGFTLAYIIVLFILGGKTNDVAAAFPSSLFLQMILIPAFFFTGITNGALNAVAQKFLYLFRNKPILIPFVFLLIAALLGIMGSGAVTNNLILSVMVFNIGLAMGMSPWVCLVIIVYGANLTSFLPWSGYGVLVNRIMEEFLPGMGMSITLKMTVCWIIFTVILFLLLYFLTKGYRVKAIEMEKPADLNDTQKKTVALILAYVVCLIIPIVLKMAMPKAGWVVKLSNAVQAEILALIGLLVMYFMKIVDQKTILTQNIKWATALQVAGMVTLLNVAKNYGVTDYIGGLMSENVSAALMPVLLCLLGGFLSYFAGAIATVTPMLAAIAVPYAASTGIPAVPLILAIMVGASATAISPFSSGGAFVLSMCPNDEMRDKMFTKCLVLAIGGLLLACVLSATLFKLFA